MSSSRGTRGTIQKTPIAQIVAYIYRRELNGTLVITDEESKECKIFFIKGMPSFVEGQRLGHPVGEIFVEAGLITQEELEHHIKDSRAKKIILGQYLLQNGIVDKRQLETAIRIQIRKRIKDIFKIFKGDFTFFQEENLTNLVFDNMVQTNLPAILPESLRLTWSDDQLKSKLEEVRGHKFIILDHEACRKSYGWSRSELTALEYLDGKPWTLGQIELAVSEKMRDFMVVVYTLLLTGKLKFDEGADEEESKQREEARKKKLETMYGLMNKKLRQIQEGNFFDLLDSHIDDGINDIRDNYIRLLRDYHPDKVEPLKDEKLKEGFEKISMKIKEAMDVLSDSEAREKYVKHLQGETDSSKEEEKIVRQTLKDEMAYQKTLVLVNKKKWQDVITLLEPIIERGTENGEYLAAYAWAKISSSGPHAKIEEYLSMLQKAVELAPRSERVNFYLALALQREGKIKEYEEHIRTVVEINPHNIEAKRHLHIIKMRRKKEKKFFMPTIGKSSISDKFKDLLKKKK